MLSLVSEPLGHTGWFLPSSRLITDLSSYAQINLPNYVVLFLLKLNAHLTTSVNQNSGFYCFVAFNHFHFISHILILYDEYCTTSTHQIKFIEIITDL